VGDSRSRHPPSFRKRRIHFLRGRPPDFFHVVQEGRVKLFKGSSSGKNLTFSIAHYGDTLHGIVLLTGKPRWISAQAMDEVILLCIWLAPGKDYRGTWHLNYMGQLGCTLCRCRDLLPSFSKISRTRKGVN